MSQESKIALITGAGSGIGRAVAIALARDGWQLALAGRKKARLLETGSSCQGAPALILPMDVTDPLSVQNGFEAILDRFGRLDLLFNNAGIGAPSTPFESLSLTDWNAVLTTNLTGAFLCAREAFRIMKQQQPSGGRIINNGSVSAHVPRPQSAPYTASKHGITGLTRAISLDGRAYDICCGQIDIGNAGSEMTQKISRGIIQADGTYKAEPVIPVEAVADAVRYMANLPTNTNIPFMTVMANQMPYMGRG